MDSSVKLSPWTRFWHVPVRAERLALMRILLGLALLTDQLFQLVPNAMDFYGYSGVAPAGLFDGYQLRHWYWTVLVFNTDDPAYLYPTLGIWVLVTFLFTIGWNTRLMNVLVWFLTMCFVNRNPNILSGSDDTLQMGLFLLMLGPTGAALSVDAWLARRAGKPLSAYIPAWPVRLLQIELCVIYLSTGLAKLVLPLLGDDGFASTWWRGTAVHYVLNYVTMSRWSYAQLPLPLWFTGMLTYVSVWWEVLFPVLVLFRRTRGPALLFGLLFHLGIYLMIEIGWFSFYMMAFYGVWTPCRFWAKRDAAPPADLSPRAA